MLKNKKGQLISLSIGMIIAIIIGILLLVLGIGWFVSANKWIIIGVVGLIFSFIYAVPAALKGDLTTNKVLFLVFLFVIFIGLMFVPMVLQTSFGSGLTITSISKNVPVISSDSDLSGVWFYITAVSNGGQSIVGTLTPQETSSLSGTTTKYPLTIEANSLDEVVNYKIINTNANVYKYLVNIQHSDNGYASGCKGFAFLPYRDAPSCSYATSYEIPIYIKGSISGQYLCTRICVTKKQIGTLGDIEKTNVVDEMDVALTVNGERIVKRISSITKNADFVSSSKGLVAQVQLTQLGWTGNFPPELAQYRALYNTESNTGWTIINRDDVTNYNNVLASVEGNLATAAGTNYRTDQTATSYENYITGEVNRLANSASLLSATNQMSSSITNKDDVNNGKLTFSLDRQIGIGNFLIKARADWIGVVISTAKPQIVSSTCADFRAGDSGKATINVKNIGTATGTFVYYINCPTIKQSYTPSQITINAGDTKTLTIVLDANNNPSVRTDACQIIVKDYNKESNSATTNVNCNVLKPSECVESRYYNEANCIKKCISGTKNILKCCGVGEAVTWIEVNSLDEFGGYYCKAGGNDKCTSNSQCVAPATCVNGQCITPPPTCTTDAECGVGKVCTNGQCNIPGGEIACNIKAVAQPWMGWQWVVSSTTSCGWNPLCYIGLMEPSVTSTGSCKSTYLAYYILGGIALVMIIIVTIFIYSNIKKKKKTSKKGKGNAKKE